LPRRFSFGTSFAPMKNSSAEKPDIHSESFLHALMRRQLKLSIACAATFMIALLGMPLANYFLPELMATRVFGFTLTWFILGVAFFPFVWIISYVFIKRSIALEESEVKEVQKGSLATDAKEAKV
jgi:uncharacterized membrane protein (DUF485 family)